ncbi:hypothetical protein [Hyphomicrobium sp. ghe19]|uniref:hypothetical protein n=1 Tax=Hyphomicrobium sp. ghe19 TaxID=2682968 RepID=UPI00136772DD|nr:hypothetical protein HYPP_02428 [Hyphomicrobium sp. ghe19]
MSRRSAEAHALQNPLFRQKIVADTKVVPVVCEKCSGYGEIRASRHDEGEMCPTCGGLGFALE